MQSFAQSKPTKRLLRTELCFLTAHCYSDIGKCAEWLVLPFESGSYTENPLEMRTQTATGTHRREGVFPV